jgi:uncharacterized Fe-S cluster protein YjdI
VRTTYVGVDVDVSFDPEVCVHSGNCVRGQPPIFDTSRKPWIVPDAAAADDVVAQVQRCPSGALEFERHRE